VCSSRPAPGGDEESCCWAWVMDEKGLAWREFIELLHVRSTSLPYTLHRMEFWSWEAHWVEEDTLDGHSDKHPKQTLYL
jgi:hypothetical protein